MSNLGYWELITLNIFKLTCIVYVLVNIAQVLNEDSKPVLYAVPIKRTCEHCNNRDCFIKIVRSWPGIERNVYIICEKCGKEPKDCR